MTPKEKTEELIEKMMLYSYEKIENEKNTKYIVDNKIKKEYATQCALIAVDEILNNVMFWWEIPIKDPYFINQKKYWTEVQQEIEKL